MKEDYCPHCSQTLSKFETSTGTCMACHKDIHSRYCSKCSSKLTPEEIKIGKCISCGTIVVNNEPPKCPKCSAILTDLSLARGQCHECLYTLDKKTLKKIELANKNTNSSQVKKLTQSEVTLTTAPSLADFQIIETIDVIAAECVIGMHFFKDLLSSFTDILGGRSKTTQKTLRQAKETCLNELRSEAASKGANAVIGVDLDYSEISAQGKSMLFLVASGTAVRVEKKE